ncbi:MAG TPA: hypothetical protein VFG10_19095 [Saprospiraceae bacterium]|nr:hypothetical protein [Saprospiraceae bacterium]
MKKAILIIGSPASGKTIIAKLMANVFRTVIVSAIEINHRRKREKYFFNQCDKDTQLIVVDGIKHQVHLTYFFTDISRGVIVVRRLEEPFEIQPGFIFISSSIPPETISDDASFTRRFKIYNMDHPGMSLGQLLTELNNHFA